MRLLAFALLVGCGSEEPGTEPSTAETAARLCEDAPVVTWDNFGAGFVTQSCQSCHASTTPDRHGAPEDVVFDTEEDVWAWSDRILVRSIGEEPTMPPQGGVSEDDRYLLEVWLTCGG
jgi:uncharacterized membrane protein